MPARLTSSAGSPWLPQRGGNGLGVFGGDSQKSTRRSFRLASALFPILQGCDTHANHARELSLRLPEPAPDCFHINSPELGNPARRSFATPDLPSLPNTRNQVVKVTFSHETPPERDGSGPEAGRPSNLLVHAWERRRACKRRRWIPPRRMRKKKRGHSGLFRKVECPLFFLPFSSSFLPLENGHNAVSLTPYPKIQ